jgi:hypothetical protein
LGVLVYFAFWDISVWGASTFGWAQIKVEDLIETKGNNGITLKARFVFVFVLFKSQPQFQFQLAL